MNRYPCYYARHPAYGLGSPAAVDHYQRTGAWAATWPEPYGAPAAYAAMQVERMPRRARERLARIIAEHDLPHTSMCAGDVVEDVQAGTFYKCDLMGWREMH